MNQPENYQLHLIEIADAFSPEPINANTRAIESKLLALAGSAVRAVVGTYTGTGTANEGNPCTLNLGFRPKFLLVMGEGYTCFFVEGCARAYGDRHDVAGVTNTEQAVTWTDTGVSWYVVGASTTSGSFNVSGGTGYQMNLAGRTYYYFAIG